MSINVPTQILLHKSKEERTEVISRLLITFVTHKLQEHLNFSNTFSYLFHNYDVTSLENIRLVFSPFFDIRGNFGNVKEKPARKTCFSREKSALLHASIRQNFAWRHFFDVSGVSIVTS